MAENSDVAWPIQVAMHARATGDAALSAAVTGVYDHVPESAALPYVTIGEFTVTPTGAHDRFGSRATVTLHAWSTYHGRQEITAIVGHLVRLFDHQPLDVDGAHTVYVHHEQTVTLTEQNNDIRHAACRFAIETEQ